MNEELWLIKLRHTCRHNNRHKILSKKITDHGWDMLHILCFECCAWSGVYHVVLSFAGADILHKERNTTVCYWKWNGYIEPKILLINPFIA